MPSLTILFATATACFGRRRHRTHGNQLIALDAALGINIFDRLARAVEFHIAPLGYGPDIAPTTATLISLAKAAWGHRQCD